jgi:hypothetical protein
VRDSTADTHTVLLLLAVERLEARFHPRLFDGLHAGDLTVWIRGPAFEVGRHRERLDERRLPRRVGEARRVHRPALQHHSESLRERRERAQRRAGHWFT